MNEPSLNDPHLQSLEARLAAMPPQESAARQQELLYRCAFAAGQSSARTTVLTAPRNASRSSLRIA